MLLAEPYEFIDLADGESEIIRVDTWQDGSVVIHPRVVTPRHVAIHMHQRGLTEPPPPGTPIANEVGVIRLFGERVDKQSVQRYFDVSSKTLRADLLARLTAGLPLPATIRLEAHGQGQRKRYSVETLESARVGA